MNCALHVSAAYHVLSEHIVGSVTMAALLTFLAVNASESAAQEQQASSLPPAEDLGIPVRWPNLISHRLCPGAGPQGHDLMCFTTNADAGHFGALDLVTGELQVRPFSGSEAYIVLHGSDGSVYVGLAIGVIMRYRPGDGSWERLAAPFQGKGWPADFLRAMDEGRDGWLYCGNCTGDRARVNMSTGQVEELPPIPEEGKWYVCSVCALPDGRIAFGLAHMARVFIYDPVQGKDVGQWAPERWLADGIVSYLAVGGQVLYGVHSVNGERGAWEIAGSKDTRRRAVEKARQILSNHYPVTMDGSTKKNLEDAVREIYVREGQEYRPI